MSQKCGTENTEPIMNEHEKVPSLHLSLTQFSCIVIYYMCVLYVNYAMKNVKKRKGNRDIQNEEWCR